MNETSQVEYLKCKFDVMKLFPSNSELAVEILRLQAFINDIMQEIQWLEGDNPPASPSLEVSLFKRTIRMGIQYRFGCTAKP